MVSGYRCARDGVHCGVTGVGEKRHDARDHLRESEHLKGRRHVRYAFGDVKRESAVRPVIVCDVGKAIWWHSTDQHAHAYERKLDGEIHLPLDLQPSSDFPYFGVQVSAADYGKARV